MTRVQDYIKDQERVWSAIVVIGSIAGVSLLMVISHLILGR
jgi:hypothetical protein